MDPLGAESLRVAVERLHSCNATYTGLVAVSEKFKGQVVWEGSVLIFTVDRRDTDTCYAWSSPIEGAKRRKIYAVLKIPPVDGPAAAVRASIVADHKGNAP